MKKYDWSTIYIITRFDRQLYHLLTVDGRIAGHVFTPCGKAVGSLGKPCPLENKSHKYVYAKTLSEVKKQVIELYQAQQIKSTKMRIFWQANYEKMMKGIWKREWDRRTKKSCSK
jgi:hypothetical protein